jgi:N6-L-threonylcarbamoyladenine synthase
VLVIAGGVAANQHIFAVLQRVATDANFRLSVPPAKLCTDNAAMIAWAALERFDRPDDLAFAPRPRWPLDPEASPPPGRGVRQ